MRRFARAMPRDPALAADRVQDCLARALARQRLSRPGTHPQAWPPAIRRNHLVGPEPVLPARDGEDHLV